MLQSGAPHHASRREDGPAGPAQREEVSLLLWANALLLRGNGDFCQEAGGSPQRRQGSAAIREAAQRSRSTAAVPGQTQPEPEPVPSRQTKPSQPCWQRAQRDGSDACSAMERL